MMRGETMKRLCLAPAVLAIAGCYVDDPSAPPPAPTEPTTTIVAGGFTVRVDAASRDVALLHGNTVLLDFPADALELGTVPAPDNTVNYDPYELAVPTALDRPPTGLAWLSPASMKVTSASSSAIVVSLAYPGGISADLRVTSSGAGTFDATLVPAAASSAAGVAYYRLRPRVDAEEGLYGLGESFDDVNQRGKIRAMQLEIDASSESGYNNVHVPIPFLIGTRGWGLFVESRFPGVFEVATSAPDLVQATFGTGVFSAQGIAFHLFGEDQPLDVTRHYYDVTGYPTLPARWALGPWVWRHITSQAEAEGDLQTLRALDLPTTGYWIDDGYATAVDTFDWSATEYTDPVGMIEMAHDLGFGMALWHVPYLDTKAPQTAALRAEATAAGYYPKVAGLPLNPFGELLDFTNPAAFAWWQGQVTNYTMMGIEGFKLDYAEDVVPGLTSGRNEWEFADGSDERTMHARFSLYYHRLYAEILPGTGGFLLCRHGTYGDQVNASEIWPGDLDATFAQAGEPATSGSSTYNSVGGLPASVIAGLSLGPSGFPFFGADTGGYIHSPPDKELFTRWLEQTALSPVMQIYSDTPPWEPDPATGYDAEMLGWYQTYTRLHLQLFPYEWTYAQYLAKDGRPLVRPLGLAHPELGAHPNDIYLFGDALLVAPVLTQGAVQRSVILPAGRWIDWWTGAVTEGGVTVTVDAPLGTLPLFLAEGGIVPMLRPTIATLRPTTQPATIDSYATTPGVLWARVAPGAASSFTVFDGAVLTAEGSAGAVKLSSTNGAEFTSGVMFEVVASGAAPGSVTLDGASLGEVASLDALEAAASGWAFVSDVGGTIYVKTPAGSHAVVISE
jgi:alpha-D-xyloside xylohydrolase